jgi:hypothetical protein
MIQPMSDPAVSIGFNRSMSWESIASSSTCTRRVVGGSKPSLSQVIQQDRVLCPARRDSQPCYLLSGEAVRILEKRKAVEEVRWCSIVPSPIGHFLARRLRARYAHKRMLKGACQFFLTSQCCTARAGGGQSSTPRLTKEGRGEQGIAEPHHRSIYVHYPHFSHFSPSSLTPFL